MDASTGSFVPATHRVVEDSVEHAMLLALGEHFGVPVLPRTLTLADDTRLEVEGSDDAGRVIVQLVPSVGAFKSQLRNRVIADMLKLSWLGSAIFPGARSVLCVSPTAAQVFTRSGWPRRAAADFGIDVVVFGDDAALEWLIGEPSTEFTNPKHDGFMPVTEST